MYYVLPKLHRLLFTLVEHLTNSPFQLIHFHVWQSLILSHHGYKYYVSFINDYSHLTWTLFLASKDESVEKFLVLLKKIEKRVGHSLVSLRSDHGKEFENSSFIDYCNVHDVDHNFSAPRTPQQNGVVEHKNRALEDITKTMLSLVVFLETFRQKY